MSLKDTVTKLHRDAWGFKAIGEHKKAWECSREAGLHLNCATMNALHGHTPIHMDDRLFYIADIPDQYPGERPDQKQFTLAILIDPNSDLLKKIRDVLEEDASRHE